MQIASRNSKVTSAYYHHNAVLRDEALASELVDILYNLNEINFQLEYEMGLDEAWLVLPLARTADRGGFV